jgi:hypothetical protein
MAEAGHLYAVIQGSYRSALLAGETWQTGVRFATRPGATPPVDVGTFVPFDVVSDVGSITATDWTVTSNWSTEMGASDLNVTNWLDEQWGPAVHAFIESSHFGSEVRVDAVKVYPIAMDDSVGRAVPPPGIISATPATLLFTGTHPSGGGSTMLPLQVSTVASLRTLQSGRKGRGRMFLPPGVTADLTAGTLLSTATAALGNAMVTLLEAVSLSGVGAGGVWVCPCVTGGTHDAYGLVKSVWVDSIPDTQRRRRRSLIGTTDISALDNPPT